MRPEPPPYVPCQVWGDDRPAAPSECGFVHPLEFAGKPLAEKLADVRGAMRAEGVSALVVAALDEVACALPSRRRGVRPTLLFLFCIPSPGSLQGSSTSAAET